MLFNYFSKKRRYSIADFNERRLVLRKDLGSAFSVNYSIGEFHLNEGKTVFALKEEYFDYSYFVSIISSICEAEFHCFCSSKNLSYDEVRQFVLDNRKNVLLVTPGACTQGYRPFSVDNLQPKDHFTYKEVKHLFQADKK